MSNTKLDRLSENDIWIFTKQSATFDNVFKAAKLFSEIPNRDTENIERYFLRNFKRYGINTDRHRILISAQLFGLLTRASLYQRGGTYNQETTTEMFELLNKYEIGSVEYNKLKTEQILKVKIRAITDSANNNVGWNVLTVIFCYTVLRQLKKQYHINHVALDLFYTYVMTCRDYSEVNEAVEHIRANSPITEYIAHYKDRSRFIKFFENISLFKITSNDISINENFDNYFNKNFIEKLDIDELNMQLSRDVDYTYFLTTHQEFNVNLIDKNVDGLDNTFVLDTPKIRNKKVIEDLNGVLEDYDNDYVEKVNEVKEDNINENIAKNAFKNKPSTASASLLKRYSKNPLVGKIAIKNADYKCENNSLHETFISYRTKNQFMEAHHLIPINQQDNMWDKFNVNVDCIENIISLCPNCHRAIHYAEKDVKRKLIKKLYEMKVAEFYRINLKVSLNDLFKIYDVL
jgi:5-methylcytosine-specific restriction protein A